MNTPTLPASAKACCCEATSNELIQQRPRSLQKRIRIGPYIGEGALAVVKEALDLDNPAAQVAQYDVKLGTISRLVVERKVCIAKLGLMGTPKAQSQAA